MVGPMQIIFSEIWSMNLKAGLSVKKALLCFKVLVLLKFKMQKQLNQHKNEKIIKWPFRCS